MQGKDVGTPVRRTVTRHGSPVQGWLRLLTVLWLLGISSAPDVLATSSVNVPLDHWSYAALEKLDGFGLIHSDLQGTRPFTRMEVARLVSEALIEKQRRDQALPPLIEHFLDRFKKEFKDELGAYGQGTESPPKTFIKPLDEVQARYVYVNGEPRRFNGYPPKSQQGIEATEGTPLVYNNEGIIYGEHHNGSLQFSSSMRFKDIFSAYLQPIVVFRENQGDPNNLDDVEVDLLKGYAKISPWNVELEAGRDSMWWGQGRHGSLILTNNATPLDMIKLSNPVTTLLPWYFRYLGPFKYTLFVSKLEDHTVRTATAPLQVETTDVQFGGFRVDFKPFPIFEFGAATTFIFGGEGRPSLGFGDILDIFGFQAGSDANPKLNQLGAIDARLQIEYLWNAELYGEFGGEDTGGGEFAEEFLFGDIGYMVGLYLPRLTPDGRLDLRVEYANTSHTVDATPGFWYGHQIYRSGYTHDGLIMGHHMDGDADDWFARTSYYVKDNILVGLDFNYMVRGKSLSPTEERVQQVGADVTYDFTDNISITARLGFGTVDNFDLRAGDDREDQLLMTVFKYQF